MLKKADIIGFYCSSLSWGGLEMNLVLRARWLCDKGRNVSVLCVQNSQIEKEAKKLDLDIIHIRRNLKYCDIVNAIRVNKILARNGIKILWIRNTRDISIAGIVKRISGGKIKIVYQQAMQIGVNKRDIFHTVRFSAIDAWITPLKFLAKQVKIKTRLNLKKVHVVPLGVELDKLIGRKISQSTAREILNIPHNKKFIGVIGRIDPLKGRNTVWLYKSR